MQVFNSLCVCVFACTSVCVPCVCLDIFGGQNGTSDPPERELQIVMSNHVGAGLNLELNLDPQEEQPVLLIVEPLPQPRLITLILCSFVSFSLTAKLLFLLCFYTGSKLQSNVGPFCLLLLSLNYIEEGVKYSEGPTGLWKTGNCIS